MTTQTYTDINLSELETLRQQPNIIVIDVRDEWEFEEFNIGGINIPLPDIRAHKDELLPYHALIVLCTNGVRSRVAAKDFLRQPEFQDKAISHLQGGIIEQVG